MTKYYLVNDEKAHRAQDILNLLNRAPKDDGEAEQKGRFGSLLTEANLKTEEEKLRFVYIKLGGLVRTEEEQKVAEIKKEEIKKKTKKIK